MMWESGGSGPGTAARRAAAGALCLAVAAGVSARGAEAQTPGPGAPPATTPPMPGLPPAPPAAPGQPGSADAAGERLSLDEAVRFAIQNNPRVAGAAAQVREARARITQRRAVRLPQLGMDNFIFRQGPVIEGGFGGGAPVAPPYRWTVGVFLSQVLFDWGQRSALQRSAEREAAAAGLRLNETENNVRLVVSVAFYNVLRAEQLLQVARERREAAAEQLRVSRARFESDVAPRFDVIRSEAELANAEQDVIAAQNDVALAAASLNTALGRDVAARVALEFQPEQEVEVSFEAAREAAVRSRPQLAALREAIEADRQDVRARRAENRPQIALNSTYRRQNTTGLFGPPQRYDAGLVMTFPFFDSGLTRGRVREAQAVLESTRQALEQARQQVELDVRQAQLDMVEARQRIATAETELRAAREALRVAEVRYRAGVGTNVEVTDAQVAVARAGQNVANARFDYLSAVARLEEATGVPVESLRAPGTPDTPGGAGAPGGAGGAGTPGGAGAPAVPAAPAGSAAPGRM